MSNQGTVASVFALHPHALLRAKDCVVDPNINVPSTRYIGIEVEVENIGAARGITTPLWVGKEDGSLRNRGHEFVTNPLPANVAGTAFLKLFNEILKNDDYSFTPRTSVHVHVNAQDLTYDQVKNLIILYGLFENVLYSFVGRGRKKSIFCVPMMNTSYGHEAMEYGLRRIKWQKYMGLNLCTLSTFGTAEFRHMHGCNDIDKLNTWVGLVTNLVDYAAKVSHKSIRTSLAAKDFDPVALAEEVFGQFYNRLKTETLSSLDEHVSDVKGLVVPMSLTNDMQNKVVRSASSPFFAV